MRTRAAFVAFFAVVVASAAAAAPSQRIFRIDHAKVKIEDRRLVITADGAVRTGGWQKPRLRMHEVAAPETNTLEVEFLATPPQTTHAVAQAILPVKATLKTGLPHYGAVQVKIVSETNSMTVPITH
ncbi:MAG: hypothetical protein WCA81_10735 [Rhizomicrobium sp.]